ncbi:MAG: glycosyltransferase family 39 protein [bacterium]|nr:glycosyltransferase family 39 protein [bacterium]
MKKQFGHILEKIRRLKGTGKSEAVLFILYLAGFLILAVPMAVSQPHIDTGVHLNPPDEYSRMLIPKFICEHGTLPTGLEEEVRIGGYGFSYGLYNTLPYIIQGWFMRFVSLFTDSGLALLYAGRFVSVVFGCMMAVFVYLLGKRLFKDRRFRWLFCAAVMYLPENMFVHTYVNTDSCCLLAVSMILYALVWGYQEGFRVKNCICLAVGIILCTLSYYNAYGYILSAILLFAAYYIVKENGRWRWDFKKMFTYGALISALVIIGAGWWFVRAYIVLDGDFLGLKTREQMSLLYALPEVSPLNTYQARGVGIFQMLSENRFFQCLYDSFIAAFGSITVVGSRWTYFSYKLLFGAGILGGIWSFGYLLGKKGYKTDGKALFFHLNMILCMALPLFLLIRYAYTIDYQAQGRYMLPSLIPMMYYTVRGIQELSKAELHGRRLPARIVNLGVAFSFFIAVGSSFYMVFVKALPVFREVGIQLTY